MGKSPKRPPKSPKKVIKKGWSRDGQVAQQPSSGGPREVTRLILIGTRYNTYSRSRAKGQYCIVLHCIVLYSVYCVYSLLCLSIVLVDCILRLLCLLLIVLIVYCVSIYVCMCIYMCICAYMCMCAYMCTCACANMRKRVIMQICGFFQKVIRKAPKNHIVHEKSVSV